MKYLVVDKQIKFNELCDIVGPSNVDTVLALNGLTRDPDIGVQLYERNEEIMLEYSDVSPEFKLTALGRASKDSDVFETMALLGNDSWKVVRFADTLPNTLKIPESINISNSVNILGNSQRVDSIVYGKVVECLSKYPYEIDPEIFNNYYSEGSTNIVTSTANNYTNLFQFFKIPWGKMSIYSSISDSSLDFPVYPEEISDAVQANYSTMSDIIYQYEPWMIYNSSGPRSNNYSFTFHRDMWTGDHRDGKANELVRFCMANCYPEYNGSAVNSS